MRYKITWRNINKIQFVFFLLVRWMCWSDDLPPTKGRFVSTIYVNIAYSLRFIVRNEIGLTFGNCFWQKFRKPVKIQMVFGIPSDVSTSADVGCENTNLFLLFSWSLLYWIAFHKDILFSILWIMVSVLTMGSSDGNNDRFVLTRFNSWVLRASLSCSSISARMKRKARP